MVHANDLSEPWEAQRRGRAWFVLLLGVVVFALFGAVVGYAYLRGLPGMGGEPPLIRAQAGPYRAAPVERGGIPVPNAKSSIVTVLRPQTEPPRVERLLPAETATPLESPEPGTDEDPPLAALGAPGANGADAAPSAAEGTAPVPDAEAALPTPGVPYPRTKPLPPVPTAGDGSADATISALPAIEPAAAPPATVPTVSPPDPSPTVAAPAQPPTVTAAPAPDQPADEAGPQRLVRATPAPTEPAATEPAAATSTPARPATGGIYRLQLAAVRSENGLTQAWADLRQRYPAALSTVNPQVERTDTTSGPLFRLQAGPFGSREAAADACGSIRSSGGQCFIVGPIAQ